MMLRLKPYPKTALELDQEVQKLGTAYLPKKENTVNQLGVQRGKMNQLLSTKCFCYRGWGYFSMDPPNKEQLHTTSLAKCSTPPSLKADGAMPQNNSVKTLSWRTKLKGPRHMVLRKTQGCRIWGITWLEHHMLLSSLSVCKLETFIPDNNKQRCYLGCWLNLDAGFIWASWARKTTPISFCMMRTLMTLCASAECESISQRGGQGRMKKPPSFQVIIIADSISGVPNFQDLMPDALRGNWYKNNRNKVHNTCNALKTPPNHPPTLVHGKTVFQDTGPWCQKDWRPLLTLLSSKIPTDTH